MPTREPRVAQWSWVHHRSSNPGCISTQCADNQALHATETKIASARSIAGAAAGHGRAVMEHLVMIP